MSHRGSRATGLLDSTEFVTGWERLAEACPWGTVFQTPGFVRSWYRTYRQRFEPYLIVSTPDAKGLNGLLLLAIEMATGQLVVAGTHHAEYQTWLAGPSHGDVFIEAALECVRRDFPGASLRMSFLPAATPLAWLRPARRWYAAAQLSAHARGLMRVGPGSAAETSLRKSINRSKLNRLKRIGPVRLDVLATRQELQSVIDEIVDFCDLRQGAVNGSTPFHSDPLKREHYLARMDVPGLAHATVLRVGDRVAAAHLSVRNRDMVPLGLITHSPHLAQHSPGKLILLLLADVLRREGDQFLDLTPGGEYKERFATDHDTVHALHVFFGKRPLRRIARPLKRMARIFAGQASLLLPELSKKAKQASTALRQAFLRPSRWLLDNLGPGMRNLHLYRLPDPQTTEPPVPSGWHLNTVRDLMAYTPAGSKQPRRVEFLQSALRRIEAGHGFCTLMSEDTLRFLAWFTLATSDPLRLIGEAPELPVGGAVLYDDNAIRFPAPQTWLASVQFRAAAARDAGAAWIGVIADARDAGTAAALQVLGAIQVSRIAELPRLTRAHSKT